MISGETSGSLIGKCGCEGRPLKEKMNGENAGDFDGGFLLRRTPLKGKNDGGSCREGKWAEKLHKLSFLKLEIMLKMDISRQTKGQNSQTNGAF